MGKRLFVTLPFVVVLPTQSFLLVQSTLMVCLMLAWWSRFLIFSGAELVDTVMVRFARIAFLSFLYRGFVGYFEEAERTLRCTSRIPDHPLTRRRYRCRIGVLASIEAAGSAFSDDLLCGSINDLCRAGVSRPDVGHVFDSPVPKSFGDCC